MSVTIRPYRRGGWEVDIQVVTPDGKRSLRERKPTVVSTLLAVIPDSLPGCASVSDPQPTRQGAPNRMHQAPSLSQIERP